jgi:hypothetical protein
MADRWGYLSYAIGGWSGCKDRGTNTYVDGAREKWKPNMAVLKVVIQNVKDTEIFQPRARVDAEWGSDKEVGGSL